MVTPMSMDVTTMATWTQRGPKASRSLPAYALCGAGVPHDAADHGAEPDGEHRVADLTPDALREDVRDVDHRNPPDQRDADRDEQERGEAVEFQSGHEKQQNQNADPDYKEWHVSSPLNCRTVEPLTCW